MKLRETILTEHSKAQAEKVIRWVGVSQQRFDELFALFIGGEYRVVQRAAWPLSYIVIMHPNLIQKHFNKLLRNLSRPDIHQAVTRNTLRLLREFDIPALYHGRVMNYCFEYFASPDQPIAVKAFSLMILQKLLIIYPEICGEFKTLIEDPIEFQSPAVRSRAKKILKSL